MINDIQDEFEIAKELNNIINIIQFNARFTNN